MRFGFVLLGLVTLTSIHTSSAQVCANGLPGFDNGNVCCDLACGICGGAGCGSLDGGASNCCVGVITSGGMLCSVEGAAPCIMDDIETCSNDIPGIQSGNVCCDGDCGECGGAGCGGLPGGASSCCVGVITDGGMLCSDTEEAPCVIDTCSNGLQGIQSDDICCDGACGTCGGSGCGGRPGGAANCCQSTITNGGMTCSTTSAAPCIIDDAVECSDGTPGIEENGVCCEAQCLTCGGAGCGQRPGGKDSCCTSAIQSSGILCDDMSEPPVVAPCIITPPPI